MWSRRGGHHRERTPDDPPPHRVHHRHRLSARHGRRRRRPSRLGRHRQPQPGHRAHLRRQPVRPQLVRLRHRHRGRPRGPRGQAGQRGRPARRRRRRPHRVHPQRPGLPGPRGRPHRSAGAGRRRRSSDRSSTPSASTPSSRCCSTTSSPGTAITAAQAVKANGATLTSAQGATIGVRVWSTRLRIIELRDQDRNDINPFLDPACPRHQRRQRADRARHRLRPAARRPLTVPHLATAGTGTATAAPARPSGEPTRVTPIVRRGERAD